MLLAFYGGLNGNIVLANSRHTHQIKITSVIKCLNIGPKKLQQKSFRIGQLDRDEHIELLETGNFGGGTGWFSGQIRNLPPVTPKNSFESDIKGLTPIDNP